MLHQVISPIIILVLVGALNKYLASKRLFAGDGGYEYKYPGVVTNMLYVCFLLPLFLLVAPDGVVHGARAEFIFMAILSFVIIVLTILYCSLYVLRLGADSIEFGAFKRNAIKYGSITAVTYHWVNNGQYLKVMLLEGRSKTFEKGVSNFDGFAKALFRKLDQEKVTFSAIGEARFT
jgi:hypothetical protein